MALFILTVLNVRNRPEYFADRLRSAMKGMGTKDSKLIRVVASRSEVKYIVLKHHINFIITEYIYIIIYLKRN